MTNKKPVSHLSALEKVKKRVKLLERSHRNETRCLQRSRASNTRFQEEIRDISRDMGDLKLKESFLVKELDKTKAEALKAERQRVLALKSGNKWRMCYRRLSDG